MRKDFEARLAKLERSRPRVPMDAWDLGRFNRADLCELIRLIEWMEDHGGDEDTLSPADRTSLRRLELRAGPAAGGLAP